LQTPQRLEDLAPMTPANSAYGVMYDPLQIVSLLKNVFLINISVLSCQMIS